MQHGDGGWRGCVFLGVSESRGVSLSWNIAVGWKSRRGGGGLDGCKAEDTHSKYRRLGSQHCPPRIFLNIKATPRMEKK